MWHNGLHGAKVGNGRTPCSLGDVRVCFVHYAHVRYVVDYVHMCEPTGSCRKGNKTQVAKRGAIAFAGRHSGRSRRTC